MPSPPLPAKPRPRSEWARRTGLVTTSLALTLLSFELLLRGWYGYLGMWPNFVLDARSVLAGRQDAQYIHDDVLGYVPRPGYATADVHFDRDGLRVTGSAPPASGGSILAIGDSYTSGEEVKDGETWPAHLQQLSGRHVLNAGVAGYGFDQTVLRGGILIPATRPSDIVVSFIADDIRRLEARRLWGADKPYFDIEHGELVLHGVPVPPRSDPRRTLTLAQRTLGYSFLFDFVLRRFGLLENWFGDHIMVHPSGVGEKIACLLTDRLHDLQQSSGAAVLVVAQYDPYVWRTPAFAEKQRRITDGVLACARHRGLEVLDTFDAIAGHKGDGGPLGLYDLWHMNDAGNRIVANLIALALGRHPN